MGSGSFGGGSGSFGGGGSGGGGGRGGGSGGGGGGGSGGVGGGKGDSAYERILKLNKLTSAVNANPEMAKVSKQIYEMLQDRTRAAFMRAMLSDPMLSASYQGLLSIEADLSDGAALSAAVQKLGVTAEGTLADLADVICHVGQSPDTDERVERIVRRAVTDVLMRTVSNGHDLYYETQIRNLGAKFNAQPLANTAGFFLGGLIANAVRGDLLKLSAEARAVIGDASNQIAVSWTDKFSDRSRRKGVSFREIMQTIADDFSVYTGGGK
ncbi:hypothetical protein GA0061099_1004146 [Bradyrhizobium yuanmingense]|uniref:Uncharacterized protein n=1 Tax=Bradyrhizobium yuanmingense TaxID=108015 RepID=A0A1C3VLJ6_9BRAD|nr:hypothetical protein IQ15_01905 [Bradyrhizobium yuanmingense]SCB28364.1 hypothetical protein GA0061099_1004146 [Bradyrhizobium yuanmingense]